MKPQSLTTSRTVSIQKLKAVTIQALPLLSHKICIHIDLYNILYKMKDSLMSSRRPASSLTGLYMMKVDFGPLKSTHK